MINKGERMASLEVTKKTKAKKKILAKSKKVEAKVLKKPEANDLKTKVGRKAQEALDSLKKRAEGNKLSFTENKPLPVLSEKPKTDITKGANVFGFNPNITEGQGDQLGYDTNAFQGDISLEDMGGFDVFDYSYKKCIEFGDLPKYMISRNGELLATKFYPYSWEKLQEEYGGGHYRVQSKRVSNNQIIKTQTLLVSEDPNRASNIKAKDEQKTADHVSQVLAIQAQQRAEDEARRREEDERRRKEESERRGEFTQLTQGFMQIAASLAQPKPDNTLPMLIQIMNQNRQEQLEMMKLQAEDRRREEERQDRQRAEERARWEKLIEKMTEKKESEFSSLEKAFKTFGMLKEYVKEEAEELSEHDGDEEGKSTTDKMLDMVLPLLLGGMAKAQSAPQVAQQIPQQVQSVQQPQAKNMWGDSVPAQQPIKKAAPQAAPVRQVGAVPTKTVITQKPQEKPSVQAPLTQTVATPAVIDEKIAEVVMPCLIASMQAQTGPDIAAKDVLSALEKASISKETALKHFSFEKVKSLVLEFNLPQSTIDWIEAVYKNIEGVNVVQDVPRGNTRGLEF